MNTKSICKAFSNEQRLKLMKCLFTPKNVTELLTHCSLSQSALSQHLKILRQAGLVNAKRRGKQIIYSVDNYKIKKVTNLLLDLI